jgi:hypothetical protein
MKAVRESENAMLWLFWRGLMDNAPTSRVGLGMLAVAAILACSWLRFIRLGNLRRPLTEVDSPPPPTRRWGMILANIALITLIAIAIYASARSRG